VVERLETCVHGLSIAGIAGLNPVGDMDVCLLLMLCVVR
jgi:hypothetical protein